MAFCVNSILVYFAFFLINYADGELKLSRRKGLFMYDGWCYGDNPKCGEPSWEGLCKNGTHQSPIDLPPLANLTENHGFSFNNKSFNLDDYIVINNGLAYIVRTTYTGKEAPKFFVPYLGDSYIYKSFHIHWGSDASRGSEHSVNGKFYSGELHILLYKDFYESLHDALLVNEHSAVLAISFFLIESESSNLLAEFKDQVPFVTSNITSKIPFDISGLFKGDKAWAYFGSTSVPPCLENVAFLIFEEPVEVSAAFLANLRKMKSLAGVELSNNFKTTVPIKDHQIHQVHITYHSASKNDTHVDSSN